MVTLGALIALVVAALTLGPFSEDAPVWAAEAALLILVAAVFVLVCSFESGGNAERSNSSTS